MMPRTFLSREEVLRKETEGLRQKPDLARVDVQPGPSELSSEDITMSMKQAAEKHGLDKHEPGKIQSQPDFLSLLSPEGRDFFVCGGGGKGYKPSQNHLANHLELVRIASWICLRLPGPAKCQGVCRRDRGAKDLLSNQIGSVDLGEKHNTSLVFPQFLHQTPSGQGSLKTSGGVPAGLTGP